VRNDVNYFPLNRTNKQIHETYKRSLLYEKRDKYKVEEVNLTVEEAAAVGVAEAYQILNPPKNKKQIANSQNDMMAQLLQQNAEMAQQNQQLMNIILQGMAAKEETTPKTKK